MIKKRNVGRSCTHVAPKKKEKSPRKKRWQQGYNLLPPSLKGIKTPSFLSALCSVVMMFLQHRQKKKSTPTKFLLYDLGEILV